MPSLTENDIKKAALRFLKSHYRQRQREGRAVLSSDMRGAGGIIADGFLSFPQQEGEIFRATLEATSYDSRDEVRFKKRRRLLWWDSTALALLLGAVLLSTAYISGYFSVREIGAALSLAFLAMAITFIFFFFYTVLRPLRRYRYIYAIEQFKQYYADEQWVAIGEDVFPNYHDDAYYLELRDQCIYNGFGLMVIRENKPPLMQVTPSRQDLFQNRRDLIPLFSQEEVGRIAESTNYPNWLRQFAPRNFIDYQRQYKYQMILCGISLLFIGAVFYEELKISEVKVEDEQAYRRRMLEVKEANRGNQLPQTLTPSDYVMDTPYVWPPPVRADAEPYRGLGLAIGPPPGPAPLPAPDQQRGDFFVGSPGLEGLVLYDCSRLNVRGEAFMLQEGVYASFAEAVERIEQLKAFGLEASGVWLGCFNGGQRSYAVYFGLLFREEQEVRQALEEFENQLGDNVLEINIVIRALSANTAE